MANQDNIILLTIPEIARGWKRTTRTVESWGLKAHSKRGNSNLYLLEDVVQNRIDSLSKEALDLTQERTRKEKELADKLEMANAVERGELVQIEDITRLWVEVSGQVKAKLLGIKSRVSRIIATSCTVTLPVEDVKRIENAIDGEIKTALSELSRADT